MGEGSRERPFISTRVVHRAEGWRQGPSPLKLPVGTYSASHSSPREAQQGPALGGLSFDEGVCTTLGVGVTQRESGPPGGWGDPEEEQSWVTHLVVSV